MRERVAVTVGMIALLLLSLGGTVHAQTRARLKAEVADWSDRYVVLLSGISPRAISTSQPGNNCTFAGQERKNPSGYAADEGFGPLIGKILDTGQGYKIRYFSYRVRDKCSDRTAYYPSDTHQHLDDSARALQNQLAAIDRADGHATFDLVGHSLGGVVAAYWAAHIASDYLLSRIHSLITFDSPLNGVTSSHAFIGSVFSGPVWFDLLPLSSQVAAIQDSDAGTIARLSRPISQYTLTTNAVDGGTYSAENVVYTFANLRDQLIQPSDSLLPDARVSTAIDSCPVRIIDLKDSFECHGYVLQDPQVLQAAIDAINTTIGPPWTIGLSADATAAQVGTTITLTANTSQDIGPTPYLIVILDQDTGETVTTCSSGSTCAAQVSFDSATSQTYVAQVQDTAGTSALASDPMQVTWSGDSSSVGGTGSANLGGIDLNSYCQFTGSQSVSLDGSTANDWYCVDDSGNHAGIDMNAACQWQYPNNNTAAVLGDVNDPNSWYCVDTTQS